MSILRGFLAGSTYKGERFNPLLYFHFPINTQNNGYSFTGPFYQVEICSFWLIDSLCSISVVGNNQCWMTLKELGRDNLAVTRIVYLYTASLRLLLVVSVIFNTSDSMISDRIGSGSHVTCLSQSESQSGSGVNREQIGSGSRADRERILSLFWASDWLREITWLREQIGSGQRADRERIPSLPKLMWPVCDDKCDWSDVP